MGWSYIALREAVAVQPFLTLGFRLAVKEIERRRIPIHGVVGFVDKAHNEAFIDEAAIDRIEDLRDQPIPAVFFDVFTEGQHAATEGRVVDGLHIVVEDDVGDLGPYGYFAQFRFLVSGIIAGIGRRECLRVEAGRGIDERAGI